MEKLLRDWSSKKNSFKRRDHNVIFVHGKLLNMVPLELQRLNQYVSNSPASINFVYLFDSPRFTKKGEINYRKNFNHCLPSIFRILILRSPFLFSFFCVLCCVNHRNFGWRSNRCLFLLIKMRNNCLSCEFVGKFQHLRK